jgi:hypothetical protein
MGKNIVVDVMRRTKFSMNFPPTLPMKKRKKSNSKSDVSMEYNILVNGQVGANKSSSNPKFVEIEKKNTRTKNFAKQSSIALHS